MWHFKYKDPENIHVFCFTIVLVALPVSTYLCVVCCRSIFLVLLFQGHVTCQKCTLTGPPVLIEKLGCSWIFFAIPTLKFQPLNFLFSRTRQENKAKGLAFLRAGNRQQALECFQKCVDISPEMALEVIKVLMLLFVFLIALYSWHCPHNHGLLLRTVFLLGGSNRWYTDI